MIYAMVFCVAACAGCLALTLLGWVEMKRFTAVTLECIAQAKKLREQGTEIVRAALDVSTKP